MSKAAAMDPQGMTADLHGARVSLAGVKLAVLGDW